MQMWDLVKTTVEVEGFGTHEVLVQCNFKRAMMKLRKILVSHVGPAPHPGQALAIVSEDWKRDAPNPCFMERRHFQKSIFQLVGT